IVVVEVFAHSYELGTLTGEYECFHKNSLRSIVVSYLFCIKYDAESAGSRRDATSGVQSYAFPPRF
ncbi:hypothetical protein, partial [uncultured Duncaniella sp.]|uniref:hypothetical protein n=1 Tax=uncultured Duncaniella sp. TaxID=2768039 RepID=UPI00261570A0